MTLTWIEIVLRLFLSIILGGIIGVERETQGKPAGLRTVMLVCLASTVFVVSAQAASLSLGERVEPGRLMAGVAQGVAFLGAGLILQSRKRVRGLTTAASVWAAAAIGVAVGLGIYYVGVAGAVLVFIVLRVIGIIEGRLFGSVTEIIEDDEDNGADEL